MAQEFKRVIDPRYDRLIKSFAVSDIYDALVEIITNCDDSYHRLFKNSGRSKDGGDILIEIERRRNEPSRIIVYDKAEGMDSDAMKEKLGHSGKRTSGASDRGFMGRGIKDCTAIGEIKVDSIVGNKFYSCHLIGPKIKIEDPIPVTEEIREKCSINKKNGTVVTLTLTTHRKVPQFDTLTRDLRLHYALRDILEKKSASKVLISDARGKEKQIYSPDIYSGKPILSESFTITDYPGSDCEIKIWKHRKALIRNSDQRLREPGILIKGERAIYQCSLLKYDNDEYASYYSGRLICKYIDRLMVEFDECVDSHSEKNPAFIVDPSRKGGLNKDHPFVKLLIEEAETRLGKLIESDKKDKQEKGKDITNKETRKRLNRLAREADKLWKQEFDSSDLTDADERNIEIAKDRGIYIVPPKFKIALNKEKVLTVYIAHSHYDNKRKVRVHSSNSKVLELPQTFSSQNKKPKQHPRKEGMFYGTIKVFGRAIGTSTITIRPTKNESATATGEVVEDVTEGNDHDFLDLFEFERKTYTIPENSNKSLKIFIEKSQLKKGTNIVTVNSTDPNVAVLDGCKCTMKPTPHNYAFGEISVEGRGTTTPRKPAVITAKCGEKIAKTKVRVIERKTTGGRFNFELTSENLGNFRARWADTEGKPNLLKISATHPSISKYFGDEPEFLGQNDPAGHALLAELITDSFCTRMLGEEMKERPGGFRFGVGQPYDDLNKIIADLQKIIHKFSVLAHKTLHS